MTKQSSLFPEGSDPRIAQFVRSVPDEETAARLLPVLAKTELEGEVETRDLAIYRRVRFDDRVDLYRSDQLVPKDGNVVGVDIILEPRTVDRAAQIMDLYKRFSQAGPPGSVQP